MAFQGLIANTSSFIYNDGSTLIYLLIYVNVIIIASSSFTRQQKNIFQMSIHFAMKDLGPLYYFLGVEAAFHGPHLYHS